MSDAKAGVTAIVGGFISVLVGLFLMTPLASATTTGVQAGYIDPTNVSVGYRYQGMSDILTQVPTIFAIGLLIMGIFFMIVGVLTLKG